MTAHHVSATIASEFGTDSGIIQAAPVAYGYHLSLVHRRAMRLVVLPARIRSNQSRLAWIVLVERHVGVLLGYLEQIASVAICNCL